MSAIANMAVPKPTLKSDHFGIEMIETESDEGHIGALKSDHFGIEINLTLS